MNSEYILIKNVRIPLNIKKQWRNSVRYSISKKKINLSIPSFFSMKMLDLELEKLKHWLIKRIDEDESILDRFRVKTYQSGDIIKVRGLEFILDLQYSRRKTLTGKINQNKIIMNVPDNFSPECLGNSIERLLSRVISSHFLPIIKNRVRILNEKYFHEDIGMVRMKYNLSNWGSCSSKKNINLSSRLLFVPDDVLDYVIIHELTHLKEMNHSDKFWSIIKKIMPDYRQKEKWLKENGSDLRF